MAGSAQLIQERFRHFLTEMADFFSKYPYLREAECGLREIADSTLRPFNVAIFGRMKTGKSTLINALVGRPLAITGVEEATATINWLSYGDDTQANSFVVQWKDGRSEPLPLARMSQWAGKNEDVLAMVKATSHLELFANAEALKRVQIIDTPGTGSVAEEHEDAARSFLNPRAAEDSVAEGRKADALIYVFPPVARERDEEALATYRQGCLPGSDPYNSVAVLHKWDALETDGDVLDEVERKADRLRKSMKGVVAAVIPVSGPIALLARHAPDDFFSDLGRLLDIAGVESSLRTDERWDRDEVRHGIRLASALPWASFRRVAHLFLRHRPSDAAQFRSLCLDFSQIKRLETFLDQQFYSQTAIIKQRQGRVRAKAIIEPAINHLATQIDCLRTDSRMWSKLEPEVPNSDTGLLHWIRSKTQTCEAELEALNRACTSADRFWMEERGRMEGLDGDLQLSRHMDIDLTFVEPADAHLIRQICRIICEASSTRRRDMAEIIDLNELTRLRRRHASGLQAGDKNARILYAHMARRLIEAAAILLEETASS